MVARYLTAAVLTAAIASFGTAGSASTITNGFTMGDGVTEGNNQNRRTVVGTIDQDKDAGTINMGLLEHGDIFGIYGRIVSAVDKFTFEFRTTGTFDVFFDTDGYDVYKTGKSDPGDGSNIETVTLSGLITQGDIPTEPRGNSTDDKEVKFSLQRIGGASQTVYRTSNVSNTSDLSDISLFSASEGGLYRLTIDGRGRSNTPNDNNIAALYDINISVQPVPLPAGAVLLLTGLGGFAFARRRKTA